MQNPGSIILKSHLKKSQRFLTEGCPCQVKRKPPIDKTEWDGFFDENGHLAKSRDFICVNILERVRSWTTLGLPLELGWHGGRRDEHGTGRDPFGRHPASPWLLTFTPSQGLHPFVRTEAWKFLTGYYSWQSSQDERLTVDSTRR